MYDNVFNKLSNLKRLGITGGVLAVLLTILMARL